MAVTKIWPVRGQLEKPLEYVKNTEKTENHRFDQKALQALGDVMSYAVNEEKTERHFFVSGINCNTTCARDQFQTIKKRFDKEGGIIAFHAYQSFAPGETTPQQAHEIGVKLAKELWGDSFQVVVATHLNTTCLHNHFVLNSVSFRDGKRYHDSKATYRKLREISDRLCREYGLSTIENPMRFEKEIPYIAQMTKEGKPTRYNLAKAAIDEAISVSCNMYEFEYHLNSLGYRTQFDPNRKYWTIVPKGWNKPIRLARLGDEYTNERIYERVMSNPTSVRMIAFSSGNEPKRQQYYLPTRGNKINRVGGLKGYYLKICYELGYLPRYKHNPSRVHYLLRDEILWIEKYSRQAQFLGKNDISTLEELKAVRTERVSTLSELGEWRKELRNMLRRTGEEHKDEIREKITSISERMQALRKEIRMCDDIELRSSKIIEKVERVEREKELGKER